MVLDVWDVQKKKDLRSEADGSSGSTSELVFQAEDRSLPVVRHRHVLEYSYRGGRLPCGIVRGVHFVGSAPVHVLNLNLPIARSWPGTMLLSWRCCCDGELVLVVDKCIPCLDWPQRQAQVTCVEIYVWR